MKRDRNGVAATEMNDVAVFEISPIDLFIVDVGSVRGIPVDQHDLAVDRDNLGVEPRNLRILQYDLTDRRLPADANSGAAEAEFFTRPLAVQDREFPDHASLSRDGIGRFDESLHDCRGLQHVFWNSRSPAPGSQRDRS